MHRSYAQIPRRRTAVDLEAAFKLVSSQVRGAALKSVQQLERLGIRYALAGGLAVAAHGYLRATDDVDFLVGDEAFEKHGDLVTFKAGVPIEIDGVRIDYLSPTALGEHVKAAFGQKGNIKVVPLEILVYMKLVARRRKDQLDIVELLRRTVDIKPIRQYLLENATDLIILFDDLAAEAQA